MKQAGFASSLFLFLILSNNAFANESSVSIKSEGNASATVNVQNSFNTTNSNTNNVDSHTKIRIESNGEVKEYESTTGEDISVESSDGSSKVTVQNGSAKTIKGDNSDLKQTNRIPEDAEVLSEQVEKEMEDINEKTMEEKKNLFATIQEAITNFFRNLFN